MLRNILFAAVLSALSLAGLFSAYSNPGYNSEPVCPYPPCQPAR